MRLLPALLSLLTTALPATAQLPEDTGPHLVGIRSTTFSNPGPGDNTIQVRLWYPALAEGDDTQPDTANGPYPPVLFMHGYFAPPWFYGLLNRHLASHGFVVVAVGNQDGLLMNIVRFAQDGQALVHWAETQAADPAHYLHDMLAAGPWTGVGHSNGGEALLRIQESEDLFATLALMEPRWYDNNQVATFPGHVLTIASTHDIVNPTANHARRYYENLASARRNLYGLIIGGGHNGSLDFPSSIVNPLPHAEQHRMHRRLVGGFLRAELQQAEDELYHLFGSGSSGDPLESEGSSLDPAIWVRPGGAGPTGGDDGGFLTGFNSYPGAQLMINAVAHPPAGPFMGTRGPGLFFSTFVAASGSVEQHFALRPVIAPGTPILVRGVVTAPLGATRVASFLVP
ncbi:MAG: hypothetical protein CMK00_00660 [Planctomycetes bacterium]|nr:hypothetical protein [Planctomycetota bacterium]